jgi:Lrp/AsnC family leucine-responsive transcriptional regulator
MDEVDKKILWHIQHFGRSSYAEIGGAVGLSVSAVNERLKKLEKQGVIAGWAARVDPLAAGNRVLAFVYVLIERPEHETAFHALVCDEPAIQECHHVASDWSYLLKVRAPSLLALEELVARKIKALPGIPRSQTVIVMSTAKETAAVPVHLPPQSA